MYVCLFVYTCMYVCLYIRIYVYMYVYYVFTYCILSCTALYCVALYCSCTVLIESRCEVISQTDLYCYCNHLKHSFVGSLFYHINHIGRAVRFVDFIARFSTDLVYFSYRSSHLSLPIFGTAKSCL